MVNGLGTDTKVLTVNILSEGIELKYSSFTNSEYVLPYNHVYKVLINKSLGNIYLFFMNVPSDYNFETGVVSGFPYGGVVLNDLFDGFDWDDVLSKLKYHLDSDQFVEVDATEEKMNTLVWNNMLVGAFLQEGLKEEPVADAELAKEEATEGTEKQQSTESEVKEETDVANKEETTEANEEVVEEKVAEEETSEDDKDEEPVKEYKEGAEEQASETEGNETPEEGKEEASEKSEEDSDTEDMQEDETTSLEEEPENTEKAEEEKK